MARDKCRVGGVRCIEAPPQHSVAYDQVEVLALRMPSQILETIDDVACTAIAPPRRDRIDRPVFATRKELFVRLRVRSAADKQHALDIDTLHVRGQYDLLENAAVFGRQMRG